MKWGDFKRLMSEVGLKDEDIIFYIDVTRPDPELIEVDRSDPKNCKIRD